MTTDPVSKWLRENCDRPVALEHEVAFDLDQGPLAIRTNCRSVEEAVRDAFHLYDSWTPPGPDLQAIEVYCLESFGMQDAIAEQLERPGASVRRVFRGDTLETRSVSEMLHVRVDGQEFLWRSGELLVALPGEPTTPIRMLVSEAQPGNQNQIPKDPNCIRKRGLDTEEILDLVKVLYCRQLDLFCLHAASLVRNERGVLICGPSGSGKTTAALAATRAGFQLLSDELTLVTPDSRGGVLVSGLLVPPRLSGCSTPSLENLEQCSAESDLEKHEVPLPPDMVQGCRGRRARPALLLVLNEQTNHPFEHAIEAISREEAFVAVMDQVLDPTGAARQEEMVEAIISLVASCASFRLRAGTDLRSLPSLFDRCLEELGK